MKIEERERRNLALQAFRARDSRAWMEDRRERYPYWTCPVPVGSVRPERVDMEVGSCISAVLEPGWRTYAFKLSEERDKFETIYREHLKGDSAQ